MTGLLASVCIGYFLSYKLLSYTTDSLRAIEELESSLASKTLDLCSEKITMDMIDAVAHLPMMSHDTIWKPDTTAALEIARSTSLLEILEVQSLRKQNVSHPFCAVEPN